MPRVVTTKLKNLTQLIENLYLDNFKYNLKVLSLLRLRVYIADDPQG